MTILESLRAISASRSAAASWQRMATPAVVCPSPTCFWEVSLDQVSMACLDLGGLVASHDGDDNTYAPLDLGLRQWGYELTG